MAGRGLETTICPKTNDARQILRDPAYDVVRLGVGAFCAARPQAVGPTSECVIPLPAY